MDAPPLTFLSDLPLKEMGDSNYFEEWHLNLLAEDDAELLPLHEIACAVKGKNLQQPLSPESTVRNSFTEETSLERPTKTNGNSSCMIITNIQQPLSQSQTPKGSSENQNSETENIKGQGTDHILAERQRREKISRNLAELAALIPGFKKKDRASVLGDAAKYVKELQKRLILLEEERKKRDGRVIEIVGVVVKKSRLSEEDGGNSNLPPHVEARVSDKNVLLRIHCQKQNGLFLKMLDEFQKLHLFVVHSSVLPFGDSMLSITIVTQMEDGYILTIKDLVRNLYEWLQ
ncbi:hypothetical protein RJT34_05607 [Clitoria ternatea]|uniref:BHLH domain-containing protein n=1 Tax=Clitoria ternatea TaxID=43366 RepID=A0AAN9K392_CLITE